MNELTHINSDGKAAMVDVSSKESTHRTARAYAEVNLSEQVFNAIRKNEISKGDVLSVAKIAGIQAAKKASELIPLCHNIFISKVDITFKMREFDYTIEVNSFAKTNAPTGIEMEVLTAAAIASLTIYDMCKAMDKSIVISTIRLISKSGGKSGEYKFTNE